MKAKGYGYDDACLPESGADVSAALPTVGQPARRSSGMRDGRDGWINETSEHCYRKAKVNLLLQDIEGLGRSKERPFFICPWA